MAAITIDLDPETEQMLRERAETAGQSLEQHLRELVAKPERTERQLAGVAYFDSRPKLSHEEFARRIREMADGPPVPTLPADFSRADIYDDHD